LGERRKREGREQNGELSKKKKLADDFFLARGIHSRTAQLGALGSNLPFAPARGYSPSKRESFLKR